ncbi:centromere/kinetochore protein zw10 homolog isoform X2 [Patiria miniata]|uniref:Centromere/kinetochore protein zw10 C-terminal domain-containing protein n=1 Tax=Patiria miniata TaxID=46514 RepID=A0A914BI65_PATMI|nr:centromere/kinetochore protein zw10 homolog isoform X2 [Patiria miniata]XP_038075122.1 centromere/kinetochore protein zw10 homolog isoform X2 [Patiria miniata]
MTAESTSSMNTKLSSRLPRYLKLLYGKQCQELIVEARKLMKRELHNTKRVGTMKVDNKNLKDQKQDAKDKCHVSEGIFALPECAVSESIECLVNLAYQTLQEAGSNTPQCAIQLFYTVRNMFEIFCDVVPTYHRDSLQKLSLECALHHNNCMYIVPSPADAGPSVSSILTPAPL